MQWGWQSRQQNLLPGLSHPVLLSGQAKLCGTRAYLANCTRQELKTRAQVSFQWTARKTSKFQPDLGDDIGRSENEDLLRYCSEELFLQASIR